MSFFSTVIGVVDCLLISIMVPCLFWFLYEINFKTYKTGVVYKCIKQQYHLNYENMFGPSFTFQKDEIFLLLKVEKSKWYIDMSLFTFLSLREGKIKKLHITLDPLRRDSFRKLFIKL